MSVVIIGGLDRLKRNYEICGKELGYDLRVFSQKVPRLDQRLGGVQGILIFTDTVAHPMVEGARRAARKFDIPLGRVHSSSVSALKRSLRKFFPL